MPVHDPDYAEWELSYDAPAEPPAYNVLMGGFAVCGLSYDQALAIAKAMLCFYDAPIDIHGVYGDGSYEHYEYKNGALEAA